MKIIQSVILGRGTPSSRPERADQVKKHCSFQDILFTRKAQKSRGRRFSSEGSYLVYCAQVRGCQDGLEMVLSEKSQAQLSFFEPLYHILGRKTGWMMPSLGILWPCTESAASLGPQSQAPIALQYFKDSTDPFYWESPFLYGLSQTDSKLQEGTTTCHSHPGSCSILSD